MEPRPRALRPERNGFLNRTILAESGGRSLSRSLRAKIFVTRGRFVSKNWPLRFLKTIDAYSNVISEIPKKCREKYARPIRSTRPRPLVTSTRAYPQPVYRREVSCINLHVLLTVASLASRDSSLSWLEPRRGDFRNIASRRCRLRGVNNAPRRVAYPSARRTATVTPHASAMSAPEFAPGGKNSHLTALPPLRSWRARARVPSSTVALLGTRTTRTFLTRRRFPAGARRRFRNRNRTATPRVLSASPLRNQSVARRVQRQRDARRGDHWLSKPRESFVFALLRGPPVPADVRRVPPRVPRASSRARRASETLRRARLSRLGRNDGTLLDLGCNSGIFTERFAVEGEYDAIIAVDDAERACDAARAAKRRRDGRAYAASPAILIRRDPPSRSCSPRWRTCRSRTPCSTPRTATRVRTRGRGPRASWRRRRGC